MSRALVPVTIMASEFCQDIGDSNEIQHERYMKKLLRAYKNYVFRYLSPELSVESQVFPADGQIQLPCDFVYETKIGLMKNGYTMILDLKKDLKISNARYTDSQIESDMNACFLGEYGPGIGYSFYNSWRNGAYLGEIYGAGSGYHANRWYNIQDGVLEIGSLIPDDCEVIIEYKSTGIKDGFQLVPDEMEEVLHYKAKELFYEDKNPNLASKMESKFDGQYYKLKRLYSSRPQGYFQWLFKSFDSGIRL